MATVLITGCSSGIGRAAVRYFQARGWNVAATMRRPEQENELDRLANVRLFRLDVLDEASIAAAVEQTLEAFGRIDAVVNNAGFGTWGPFETATPEQIRNQLATNVTGLMLVTRAVLPHFRAVGGGTFVNLASIAGQVTFPYGSLYHATKFAVEGFSESLSYELAPLNIRVRVIEPGAINTDFYGRSMSRAQASAPYTLSATRMQKFMERAGRLGSRPEVVAAAIFRAATDQSARLRYPVGRGAQLALTLRRLLPVSLLNRGTRLITQGWS